MNKLPTYLLDIVEDESSEVEVDFVALVDNPAIEKSFLAFAEKEIFAIVDEDEHIITGALMLADTPIYRRDQTGEYYVVFTKETIKKIAQKFFKKGYQKNVNLQHQDGSKVDGLTMFESWIVDSNRGVLAMKGFEDVPDGSWFGSFKVENEEVWALIKEGKVKGFSVEGIFNYTKKEKSKEEVMMSEIINILSDVNK